MAGKAVLTCRPNSHPFQERAFTLEQPVKIGRSVARARPATNNAIFDCKVLSRNHALFWYTNGKFYLQDTKSSNGTFVNNQRLSKSGEESAPREVCSGDIVQFGVDVLENSRKVTHGCIVADLKLYLPDGKEAKASYSSNVMSTSGSLSVEDLYQLNQYIQEAIQREQMLESKLFTLQTVLDNIRQATDQGWKSLIAEDRLLSRVEILENQLQTYSKNFGEDKLREELRKLQEDKNQYQSSAKDFLKKVLEEKLEAVQKCQEVKRTLVNVEAEYMNICDQMTKCRKDIQDLSQKLSSQLAKNDEMEAKLQEIEEQHKETVERLEARNVELETMLERQHATEASLERQVSELEVAGHLAKKRASAYELQLKALNNIPINNSDGVEETYIDSKEDIVLSKDVDDDLTTIDNCLEGRKRNKEVIELFTAQMNLLQAEKRSRLQHINNIEDEWVEYSKKRLDGEKERPPEEMNLTDDSETENEVPPSDFLECESKADDEKVSNGRSEHVDTLKAVNREMKQIHNELKMLPSEVNTNTLNVDLEQPNIVSRNADDKLQKVQKETEASDDSDHSLTSQDTLKHSDSQDVISWRIREEEEKDILRKQLMEAQQSAKQSKNEAAQMADRVKLLTAEIELRTNSPDNRTKEELEASKDECNRLQAVIGSLQSQNSSLKEDNERLRLEKNSAESHLNEDTDERDDCVNSSATEASKQMKELQGRVRLLEEELVIVGTKYMDCNDERTKLSRELNDLKLDYQAVTHQPYFNLVFALPCIVLFVAIIIAFYPTLSWLTGTSE